MSLTRMQGAICVFKVSKCLQDSVTIDVLVVLLAAGSAELANEGIGQLQILKIEGSSRALS